MVRRLSGPRRCWRRNHDSRFETARALITGVTGQDGAYFAEYLLGFGYTVHGIKRRSFSFNTARIDHLCEDPHASNAPLLRHYGDANSRGRS